MSKKSTENLKKLLRKKGYGFRDFEVYYVVNCTPDDVDWNYSDVLHIDIVHKTVHSIQAVVTDDVTCNINVQNIPIIGIEFPMTTIQYHHSKHSIVYMSTLGPYMIIVNTTFEEIDELKTKIVTKFSIGSKGIFRILNPLIEYIIRKNNKLLMEDDLPMRERRGELRKNNHLFFKNTENYSPEFSEDRNRSNVYLKKNAKNIIEVDKKIIIDSEDGEIIGNKNGILSFFVSIDKDGLKKIWPSTCSHEGAELSKRCLKDNYLSCPWHNRKINSLMSIKNDNIEITASIDYAIKKTEETFIFKYRNDPKYYEKKPYKFLKYDN